MATFKIEPPMNPPNVNAGYFPVGEIKFPMQDMLWLLSLLAVANLLQMNISVTTNCPCWVSGFL